MREREESALSQKATVKVRAHQLCCVLWPKNKSETESESEKAQSTRKAKELRPKLPLKDRHR